MCLCVCMNNFQRQCNKLALNGILFPVLRHRLTLRTHAAGDYNIYEFNTAYNNDTDTMSILTSQLVEKLKSSRLLKLSGHYMYHQV